ncbi:TIR domain-containing protein [Streptomyces sp. NPDC047123]|uniref:toll/interleukin-1 receptor domain-containing protein n=1 Tax=Streptomyces sp. NPDC047123 TaxID=3155622 RepID=UPI0033DDF7E9
MSSASLPGVFTLLAASGVEALSEVLLGKKHRMAEMDAERQRLHLSFIVQQGKDRRELETLRTAHDRLLADRDRLLEESAHLQQALDQARRQAVEAERRCEALEHRMLAAEESLAVEAEASSGVAPGRFTVSHAGPDRPWAEWIRHRLETIGHDAAIQSWDPPAGLPPARLRPVRGQRGAAGAAPAEPSRTPARPVAGQALLARMVEAVELDATGESDEAAVLRARALADLTEMLGEQHRLTAAAQARSRPVWTFDPLPV